MLGTYNWEKPSPLGAIAAGRLTISIAHATRESKLKTLARDGPGCKNVEGVNP